MKLHEYQAKDLLKKYGIPVPEGKVATTSKEAQAIAKELGGTVVLKAQVHAGGRGKAGGIKVAQDAGTAGEMAGTILGMKLITKQTGPEGKLVQKILVERASKIKRELYLGLTLDRLQGRLVMIASVEGGMEIEEVAAASPEKILKITIDPAVGLQPYQSRILAGGLRLERELVKIFSACAINLAQAYTALDAQLLEINPLVVTQEGSLLAVDAKLTLDDSALFRHQDLESWRDLSEEDPAETEAKKFGLSYIRLEGNVGCLVNGAGLAMATMDLIKLAGGEPANFLDVGGSATKENVAEAFKIILKDSKVKAILVNIFGGIMRCDVIAEGIVSATKELHVKVPLVVRLQGTNADQGRNILNHSGLDIISVEGLSEAARKVVATLKEF